MRYRNIAVFHGDISFVSVFFIENDLFLLEAITAHGFKSVPEQYTCFLATPPVPEV